MSKAMRKGWFRTKEPEMLPRGQCERSDVRGQMR